MRSVPNARSGPSAPPARNVLQRLSAPNVLSGPNAPNAWNVRSGSTDRSVVTGAIAPAIALSVRQNGLLSAPPNVANARNGLIAGNALNAPRSGPATGVNVPATALSARRNAPPNAVVTVLWNVRIVANAPRPAP